MRSFVLLILLLPLFSFSQNHCDESKTKCFKDFFANGSSHGHFRNYFMTTLGYSGSGDAFANASGGAIAYRTAEIQGFQLGVMGIFTFNTFSSDLSAGEGGSWESQLFDVTRPEEKTDLDRLEELFLKYENHKVRLIIGRFDFDTPLMNPADGRMKPYVYSGVGLNYKVKKTFTFGSRFINNISPRSTTHFHGIGENIGVYNNGFDHTGNQNDYHHKVSSDYVWVNSMYWSPKSGFNVEYHNYWLDRININHFLSLEREWAKWSLGLEYLNQGKLLGTINQVYFDNRSNSNVLVGELEKNWKKWSMALNYSTVFGGKFLFPREFGREAFYGSISRIRLEGKNNVHLMGARQEIHFQGKKLKDLEIIAEEALMMVSDNWKDNKYQESDMVQVNLEMDYHFHNHLKGMEMKLLFANRFSLQDDLASAVEGFSQINLITNINF